MTQMTSPEAPTSLDSQRQAQAKEYAQIRRRLFVADLLFGTAYIVLWAFSGLAPWLRDQIYTLTQTWWLAVPLFTLGFGLPYSLFSAPLNYYSGFVLPHRYGQSTQSLKAWLLDQAKGALLAGVLGLPILLVIYALLIYAPNTWWLLTGVFLLIFTVLLSNLAPILLFPLFFKFQPLDDADLVARLLRLADRAGAKVQGVYTFDMSSKTKAANAALMGLGNTRRIVLGDTLLNHFSPAEIESVLAHELGHLVHKDIPLGIAFQSTLTLAGLWLANLALNWGVSALGLLSLGDPAILPLFILSMSLFGLISTPLGNIWSRWREVMADRYALESTQQPEAFISAMTRLANQNLAETQPPAWFEFLLHSHPSIHRRVEMARAFEK